MTYIRLLITETPDYWNITAYSSNITDYCSNNIGKLLITAVILLITAVILLFATIHYAIYYFCMKNEIILTDYCHIRVILLSQSSSRSNRNVMLFRS